MGRYFAENLSLRVKEDGWAGTRRERGERGYPQPTVNGRLFNALSMAGTPNIIDKPIVSNAIWRNQEKIFPMGKFLSHLSQNSPESPKRGHKRPKRKRYAGAFFSKAFQKNRTYIKSSYYESIDH
jgi:hypothetical protein